MSSSAPVAPLPRGLAIRLQHLGKRYTLAPARRDDTLRDAIAGALRVRAARSRVEEFSALDDLSLDIPRGQALGIIGRNGAGKTTLLKILGRITEPSAGYAQVRGRVGTLLEIGTGFHPELTGRENIYMSGAILGMKRAELVRRFDEIVSFAGVETFVDEPVKHYSTGMQVRLAFAVAAYLETDILLVDEVLAVGDAEFQRKCLGKMSEVANAGRTVLFVSHTMAAISRLCPIALWLDRGSARACGPTQEVVSAYLASAEAAAGERVWDDPATAPGDEHVRALSVSVFDGSGRPAGSAAQDSPLVVSIRYRVRQRMPRASIGFELKAQDGTIVFSAFDGDTPAWAERGREPGLYRSDCAIPAHLLAQGSYWITLRGSIPFTQQCLLAEDVLRFAIGAPLSGEGPESRGGVIRRGVIAPALDWRTEREGE